MEWRSVTSKDKDRFHGRMLGRTRGNGKARNDARRKDCEDEARERGIRERANHAQLNATTQVVLLIFKLEEVHLRFDLRHLQGRKFRHKLP